VALIAEITGQMKADEEASRAPRHGLRRLTGKIRALLGRLLG